MWMMGKEFAGWKALRDSWDLGGKRELARCFGID